MPVFCFVLYDKLRFIGSVESIHATLYSQKPRK